MFKIKGKINTAVCYAATIEKAAEDQIRKMCDYPLTEGSRIRIMPDVHMGKGCTIGTTMTVTDKICPNIVGVDIGCGMYTVKLAEQELDLEKIDEICHFIPSGMNVWDTPAGPFDLDALRCRSELKNIRRLECSLGTLGGGNHFIEIDRAADGTYYLVIHSGSRNLGKQTAEIYQQAAVTLHMGKEVYDRQREEIIRSFKEQGKGSAIQKTLKEHEKSFRNQKLMVPKDLCWLYGKPLEDYLHDVELCQRFARLSREKMAEIILEKAGLTAVEAFHTIHNYIDTEEMILRKGAIAAHKGEMILIPINMRDGSLLAVGKGNPEWNESAPHGAGRVMSRTQARKALEIEAYKESMEGIYTTSVSAATLDEAPMAYKPMEEILRAVGDTAEVLDILKPVYNFKAAER